MVVHRLAATTWYNVLGTFPPVLRCADGDIVITETLDAVGVDRDGVSRHRSPNPMVGPIYVEGAGVGDALRVDIIRMTPTRATGWTRSILASNVVEPGVLLNDSSDKRALWSIDRQLGTVQLMEEITGLEKLILPLQPMIGCFGVAPCLGQAFSTATSAENGGNMDYRGFGEGVTAWFPVAAEGALFFLGDCHAIQGDGEIVGTGVETTFEVEVRLSVERGYRLNWPRGENSTEIFSVGNARPLDQALQHATTDMLNTLTENYCLSVTAASHLMGQVSRYDIGNVYDPAYTVVCKVAKEWLPSSNRAGARLSRRDTENVSG